MTDLEKELREALHERGANVRNTDLRHAEAPRPRVTDRPRVLLPLAAAAAVLAVGAGVAVWAGHGSTPERSLAAGRATEPAKGASFTGTWRLTAVEHEPSVLVIPPSVGASVTFRDGELTGTDGVNTFSGHYEPTASGFRVGPLASTLVGYVGRDVARRAAIEGIAALTGDVRVRRDGPALVLTAGFYTLMFGSANSSSAAPSGSVTPGDIDHGFGGAPSDSAAASSTGAGPTSVPSYVNGSEVAGS